VTDSSKTASIEKQAIEEAAFAAWNEAAFHSVSDGPHLMELGSFEIVNRTHFFIDGAWVAVDDIFDEREED